MIAVALVNYLQNETNSHVELVVRTNYAAVVDADCERQVDIADLGGFSFVQASKRASVQPLLKLERDQNFHSVFIAWPESGTNSLADLKGHSFAFGDVNSTSGHLMPAYYMREAGLDPNALAKTLYTGGNDAAALAVATEKLTRAPWMNSSLPVMKLGKIMAARTTWFLASPEHSDLSDHALVLASDWIGERLRWRVA